MEIVGYILGGINVFIGVIIAIIRNIEDLLLESNDRIKNEIKRSYVEFGNIISGETIESGRLEMSIDRLKNTHYNISKDMPYLNIIEFFYNRIIKFVAIIIALALLSLIFGKFLFAQSKYKEVFTICIPFVFFLFQLIILILIINFEKYLKRLNNRYKNY